MDRAEVPGMSREQRLSRWIELYSDQILKTCCLYLSDQHQAEDVLQDTWIKAWKHMDELERRGNSNERAWLYRIAVNTCKDYRRTAWFRHVDRKQALEDLPPALVAVQPEDRSLTLAVMELPERYKEIVLLYYYQGLTMQETAEALGQSVSAINRRLKKAQAFLKDALEGGEAHE